VNQKTKFLIPAFAAVFALMFVFATPYVMAEGGDYHAKWDGAKHHKMHMKIQIGELSGSESVTRENVHDKMSETIALAVASYNYPDVKKASIGIAINDAGEKFLVWKLVSMDKNDDGTVTATIYVVDAIKGYEITTIEKSFDHSSMDGAKWSHHSMMSKYADLTPEEREAKYAQHKEMKQAFSSLSDDDRETIMNHFKEMKAEYASMSEEDKAAKHDQFKSMMEEFTVLSLDEKIVYLQEFANSLRN